MQYYVNSYNLKQMHSVGSQNRRPAVQICSTQRPPIPQPVSSRIINAKGKIQPWGSPCGIQCGIYGEQSGSGTFFFVHFAFLPAINIPTNLQPQTLSEVGKICLRPQYHVIQV